MFHPRTILLALIFHFGLPFLFPSCREEAPVVATPAVCAPAADSTLAQAGEVAFPWEAMTNSPLSEPHPRRAEP